MFYSHPFTIKVTPFLGLLMGGLLVIPLSGALAESPPPSELIHKTGMTTQTPGWVEQLKGQTIMENAIEGRPERAAMVVIPVL